MRNVTLVAAFVLAACQTAAGSAPQTASDAEKNEAFVRGCIELVNQRRVDEYMECWSDQTSNNGQVVSRDGVRRVISDIVSTFPDFEWRILDSIAEGDTVVVQTMQVGTHRGVATTTFNGGGLTGVPATGKRMEILTMHWFKLKDGRIVLHQAVREDLIMMRQLGLAPPGATGSRVR